MTHKRHIVDVGHCWAQTAVEWNAATSRRAFLSNIVQTIDKCKVYPNDAHKTQNMNYSISLLVKCVDAVSYCYLVRCSMTGITASQFILARCCLAAVTIDE